MTRCRPTGATVRRRTRFALRGRLAGMCRAGSTTRTLDRSWLGAKRSGQPIGLYEINETDTGRATTAYWPEAFPAQGARELRRVDVDRVMMMRMRGCQRSRAAVWHADAHPAQRTSGCPERGKRDSRLAASARRIRRLIGEALGFLARPVTVASRGSPYRPRGRARECSLERNWRAAPGSRTPKRPHTLQHTNLCSDRPPRCPGLQL